MKYMDNEHRACLRADYEIICHKYLSNGLRILYNNLSLFLCGGHRYEDRVFKDSQLQGFSGC